jgi:signal peptidase I
MPKIREIIENFVIDLIETIAISASIFVIVYFFAFQPHEVSGVSMNGNDGFHSGQYILTDKFTYRLRDPKRGEVIVFKYPLNTSYDYIKRIIALPGERIQLKNNQVILYNAQNANGLVLDESKYLVPNTPTAGRDFINEGDIVTVPKDNYFVMGDNRKESSDSRVWGFVPKEDIIGKSFFRYWPFTEIGLIKNPLQ